MLIDHVEDRQPLALLTFSAGRRVRRVTTVPAAHPVATVMAERQFETAERAGARRGASEVSAGTAVAARHAPVGQSMTGAVTSRRPASDRGRGWVRRAQPSWD
ncbi:MAG: hypothetical protein KY462_16140, partial [Actinobacteria bacterium]|nr:hypothetical protein [Actinomycetota bacterium]